MTVVTIHWPLAEYQPQCLNHGLNPHRRLHACHRGGQEASESSFLNTLRPVLADLNIGFCPLCETAFPIEKNENQNVTLLGCHNQVPQTGSLTTIEISSPTVRKARSPKSRCGQGRAPSEVSRGGAFLASSSFWWLLVFFGLWQHHIQFLRPSSHGLLSCVYLSLCPLFSSGHQSLDSGPTLNPG